MREKTLRLVAIRTSTRSRLEAWGPGGPPLFFFFFSPPPPAPSRSPDPPLNERLKTLGHAGLARLLLYDKRAAELGDQISNLVEGGRGGPRLLTTTRASDGSDGR